MGVKHSRNQNYKPFVRKPAVANRVCKFSVPRYVPLVACRGIARSNLEFATLSKVFTLFAAEVQPSQGEHNEKPHKKHGINIIEIDTG